MMNNDIARIRCYYADGSGVLGAPDLGANGHSVTGASTDVIGVEFIDEDDNVVARIDLGDGEAIGLVEMDGKPVWTDANGWVDGVGAPRTAKGSSYFSFDIQHDPAAIEGMRAYAAACEKDRPGLCAELLDKVAAEEARRAAIPEGVNPNKRAADATVTGDGTVRPQSAMRKARNPRGNR